MSDCDICLKNTKCLSHRTEMNTLFVTSLCGWVMISLWIMFLKKLGNVLKFYLVLISQVNSCLFWGPSHSSNLHIFYLKYSPNSSFCEMTLHFLFPGSCQEPWCVLFSNCHCWAFWRVFVQVLDLVTLISVVLLAMKRQMMSRSQ